MLKRDLLKRKRLSGKDRDPKLPEIRGDEVRLIEMVKRVVSGVRQQRLPASSQWTRTHCVPRFPHFIKMRTGLPWWRSG